MAQQSGKAMPRAKERAAAIEAPVLSDRDLSAPVSGRPRDHAVPCPVCDADLTCIAMVVDDTPLIMESCDVCDTRRWQLAGERIDLQTALGEVEEHAGRRR